MPSRLPKLDDSPSAYAAFSTASWQEQDAFYDFWAERWRRTMDFIRSLHWRVLQELDKKQIPEWKRFPIVNITLAMYSDYLSQFLQSRVRFSAVPESPDPSDIAAAESADHLLRYLWDRLEIDDKKTDLAAWLAATGNADVRVYWNTDTGDMIPLAIPQVMQDGRTALIPVNPQTLKPDPTMQEPVMVDAGDIGIEVVPPQLVRWNVKRSLGMMIGYRVTYDEAVSRYGEQMAESLSYAPLTGSVTTDLLTVFPNTGTPKLEDAALAIEHYLPRSSRHPRGLWWTASNNRQIITLPAPLPARSIPTVHFRWVPYPGHPTLGLSPLYDITFSNKAYDEMLARILEWLNKVVPKVIRQTGDGLKYGEFTDEPGQEIVTQPGLEPQFLVPPPPPEHFFETKNSLLKDAQFVGGYEFKREKQTPPGEATQRLRMPPRSLNEGEVIALAVINSKSSWQKLGHILLDYAAKFYTDRRVISVVGPDRTYQWREFKGSDLGNLPSVLHVDELPLYTWNRQSLRDSVIALLGTPAGQILFAGPDGQLDRERVNSAMEAVGIDVSPDTLDPDVLEAKNENHAFKTLQEGGEAPQVMPWQNDQAHLEQHTRELKSLSFKGWSESGQKAFLEHVSQHEQRMAKAQEGAQQQMLAQEKALREIRAQAETSQDIRTALGEQLVELLVTMLNPSKTKEKK